MKIAIISTGDELLKGQIPDTNGAWIASRLYGLGYDVYQITTVGDDMDQLVPALRESFEGFDLTIVGGGLGPTVDDLTAEAAASAAGVPLVTFPEAEAQIRARYESRSWTMDPVNLKQALLPENCQILPNANGTAPGFFLSSDGHRAIFLPGPPHELRPMFDDNLDLMLGDHRPERALAIFKCFGMGESNLQALVAPILSTFTTLRVSFRASFPEIALSITGENSDEVRDAADQISPLLSECAFARELIHLPEALSALVAKSGMTVASAESCTGGLIGHQLTDIPGASGWFKGAIVAYDNGVKIGQLAVPEALLESHGAVSEEVVTAMAQGVAAALKTDIGIATSGIAGPTGGTPEKPVGTVHIAVSHKNRIIHRHCYFKGYNRSRVKTASAWTAMKMTFDLLVENI